MNIWIAMDDERLNGLLGAWMERKNKSVEQGMRTLGATMARAFYEYSYPRTNLKAEARVIADVNRVYASQGKVFEDIKQGPGGEPAADSFWYFCTVGKWGTAKKIMQAESPKYGKLPFSKFDGGKVHGRMRDKSGRVPKGVQPVFVVQDRGKNSALAKYADRQAMRVGMAKAGWAQALRGLGTARDVPQWVRRHKKQLGESSLLANNGNASLTLWNQVRYSSDAMPTRYQDYVVKVGAERFVKYLEKQLRFK